MGGVVSAAEQDVGGSVPQRHHLIGVGLCGNGLCTGQTWNTHTQVVGHPQIKGPGTLPTNTSREVNHPHVLLRRLHLFDIQKQWASGTGTRYRGAPGVWLHDQSPVQLSLTKVSQLEFSALVDQQVLRLQVSVKNLSEMTVGQTPQQLKEKELKREKQ